jgi:hypothetical protein
MPLELDSYAEPEVGIAVVATAVVVSPSIRKVVRKSLVYGLAGALIAYDRSAAAVTKVVETLRKPSSEPSAEPAAATDPASAPSNNTPPPTNG